MRDETLETILENQRKFKESMTLMVDIGRRLNNQVDQLHTSIQVLWLANGFLCGFVALLLFKAF